MNRFAWLILALASQSFAQDPTPPQLLDCVLKTFTVTPTFVEREAAASTEPLDKGTIALLLGERLHLGNDQFWADLSVTIVPKEGLPSITSLLGVAKAPGDSGTQLGSNYSMPVARGEAGLTYVAGFAFDTVEGYSQYEMIKVECAEHKAAAN
jgi:hypothetical protein